MKTQIAAATIALTLLATPVLASNWSVAVLETPSGEYTASLVHKAEQHRNETVGTYSTKKEAKQAGKAAKKKKDKGFMPVEGDCTTIAGGCN